MFGWEEVYMGFSMDSYIKARNALADSGIPYRTKRSAHTGAWLGRGHMPQSAIIVGRHTDYTKQFYLFVKKEHAEQARYLIRRATETEG